jgi:hypothetical protein
MAIGVLPSEEKLKGDTGTTLARSGKNRIHDRLS